jgi:hypothetical protein
MSGVPTTKKTTPEYTTDFTQQRVCVTFTCSDDGCLESLSHLPELLKTTHSSKELSLSCNCLYCPSLPMACCSSKMPHKSVYGNTTTTLVVNRWCVYSLLWHRCRVEQHDLAVTGSHRSRHSRTRNHLHKDANHHQRSSTY